MTAGRPAGCTAPCARKYLFTFTPNVVYGDAAHLREQGFLDIPYDIPNLRLENGPAPNHVRIGWYRSVYNIPHASQLLIRR